MRLQDYLDRVYYGDTLGAWLLALTLLIVGTALLYAVRKVVVARLAAVAKRSPNRIDDLVVDLIARTHIIVIMAVMALVATNSLSEHPASDTLVRFVAVIALFFQGMSWGNGIISFWTEHYATRRGLMTGASAAAVVAFVFLARMGLFVFLFLAALATLDVQIWPLVTGLGIGGIAIALAVQNILSDLFAALSIALDKPFVVGDFIKIDTHSGTVEHIGLKTTRIRALGGHQTVIGNSDLLKARINNYQRMVERRAEFTLRVSYETGIDQLKAIPGIVHDIIMSRKLTRFDGCHFARFSESALDFDTVYWMLTADHKTYMETQQAINLEILARFAAARIDIVHSTKAMVVRMDSLAANESARPAG